MRLQLHPGQISSLAAEVGNVENISLNAAVVAVLEVFKRQHDPYTRKDLVAVLTKCGSPIDFMKDSDAYRVLGSVISSSKPTKEKGYYTQRSNTEWSLGQSPKVVSEAPSTEPSEVATAPTEAEGRTSLIQEVAGIFWSPSGGSSHELYREDIGLRRLAISQSSCFGSYSSRAASCKECPLSAFCVQSTVSKLPSLVAALDLDTVSKISGSVTKPVKTPVPVVTEPEVVVRPKRALPDGATKTTVSFEAVCTKCSREIAENSEAYHVPRKGLFHPNCLEGL